MTSRDRNFREQRKRGFDDDNDSFGYGAARPSSRPPMGGGERPAAPAVTPTGPIVDATVKWFKSEKGFGFVELADGTGDAFLHASALEAAGFRDVSPRAKIRCRVGRGQKGPQVTQVVEIDESTAEAPIARPARAARGPVDSSDAEELSGTVKWYNPEKGFGFVSVDDGGKDVFVHASVLERAGLNDLVDGQSVRMRVVASAKGREAVSIEAGA